MASPKQLLDALEATTKPLGAIQPYVKMMIYGPSGVGKTVFALQMAQEICPTDKEIIYYDSIEGWVSARNHKGLTDNVRRIVFDGLVQFDTLSDAIEYKAGSFGAVGVLIIDEASTFAKRDLDTILKARGTGSKGDSDPDRAEWPDYQINTERVRRRMIKLLSINDLHIIIVAHERIDKNQKTGVEVVKPGFMPKLNETIKEMLHISARMTAEQTNREGTVAYTRTLQVHPTKTVDAKSRVGGLDVKIMPSILISSVVDWMDTGKEVEEREPIEDEKPLTYPVEDDSYGAISVS